MNDIKVFEEYVNNMNYIYTKQKGLIFTFKKMQLWEEAKRIRINNWTKELLIDLCKNGLDQDGSVIENIDFSNKNISDTIKLAGKVCSSSYHGLYTSISYINEVLKFSGREDLCLKINDFKNIFSESDLFTKDEIIEICNLLENVQDKFIVYGLFMGIKGNKYMDLVGLKTKDINFETKEIKLPSGKIIIMDGYLEDILRNVTDKELGSCYYKLNRSGLYDINSFYKFNMSSEYVLKVKPTVNNNDGRGMMSFQGLQTRFKGLSSVLGTNILGVNIYRSGAISKMHEIKDHWVQSEILKFLKDNQYNLTAYETQRAFESMYDVNTKQIEEEEDKQQDKVQGRTISSSLNTKIQASKNERNKEIGTLGENFIFENEKRYLIENGRKDLADKVQWISNPIDGIDGSIDIKSFFLDGTPKNIEVKSSSQNTDDIFTFYITKNEIKIALENQGTYVLVLVDGISKNEYGIIEGNIVEELKDPFNTKFKPFSQTLDNGLYIEGNNYICKYIKSENNR